MLSKNSASSRAIPVTAMHDHIRENTAAPVYWGKNQPGMKAKEELQGSDKSWAYYLWTTARDAALDVARQLNDLGSHKQITNRITEPYMIMKTVISGTEWRNFFWLRDHHDAQPEIHELASKMFNAYDASTPQLLQPGEWHVPYVRTDRSIIDGSLCYYDNKGDDLTAEEARIVSSSCCAQVSYRKNDDSYDKAVKIYKQLIESEPAHASPVEHQATPIDLLQISSYEPENWKANGVTHTTHDYNMWSGNLRGWVQFRKLIPNEAKW
jgi:hypothetical protein